MAADEPSGRSPDEILVGGPERRPIVLADHDPAWRERFAAEHDRIREALGPAALEIEHIGSTAVDGLAAKPIIDILVAVTDPADEAITAALVRAGYVLRVRGPAHRMLRTPELDVHVHLWVAGSADIERHLRFRDRLRASAQDRRAYEGLKRRLARREWAEMNDYADAKSLLIAEILTHTGDPSG